MVIHTQIQGTIGYLFLEGRFDYDAHKPFRDASVALLDCPDLKTIVINLAGVVYMDSSALGMLLVARGRAEVKDMAVALHGPNSTVATILRVAHFERLFPIT